jgi:RNA polymerase sigma factor (sigma-70 family)
MRPLAAGETGSLAAGFQRAASYLQSGREQLKSGANGGDHPEPDDPFRKLGSKEYEDLLRYTESISGYRARARGMPTDFVPEDALQEVFLKVGGKLNDFHGETLADFCAWVRGFVTNTLRNLERVQEARRKSPLLHLEDFDSEAQEEPQAAGPSPSEILEESERALALECALRILPSTDRRILTLVYLQSVAPEKVAARLGLSQSAVYKSLKRSLGKLLGYLGSHPRYRNLFFI